MQRKAKNNNQNNSKEQQANVRKPMKGSQKHGKQRNTTKYKETQWKPFGKPGKQWTHVNTRRSKENNQTHEQITEQIT